MRAALKLEEGVPMEAFGGQARVEMFALDDATEDGSSPGTNAATPAAS